MAEYTYISGTNNYLLAVVGESHYQKQLNQIARKLKIKNQRSVTSNALLCLEDNNPHDDMAVRVDIHRKHIGYLNRENARLFRQFLSSANISGTEFACAAKIYKGREGIYGVWLDVSLDNPESLRVITLSKGRKRRGCLPALLLFPLLTKSH